MSSISMSLLASLIEAFPSFLTRAIFLSYSDTVFSIEDGLADENRDRKRELLKKTTIRKYFIKLFFFFRFNCLNLFFSFC